MATYKEARLKYKPNRVRTLFIGESPPAKGDYFYFGGSNNLLRYIRQAFVSVYGDKCGGRDDFLQFFKENGYYLVDLSEEPINWKSDIERKQLRLESINSLAKRVKDINPESVIIFMKAIEADVKKAVKISGLTISGEKIIVTKFPGLGNQRKSVKEIADALLKIS